VAGAAWSWQGEAGGSSRPATNEPSKARDQGYHQQSSASGLSGRADAVPLNSPLQIIDKQGMGGTRLSRVCALHRAGDDQSTRPSPNHSPLKRRDPSCTGRCARRDSRKSRPGQPRHPRPLLHAAAALLRLELAPHRTLSIHTSSYKRGREKLERPDVRGGS
jgi:hypothetical protein